MSGRPRAAHTLGQTQGTVTHPQIGNMWPAGLLNRCFICNCGVIAVVGGRFILQLMFYLVDSIVKLINVLLRSFSICVGGGYFFNDKKVLSEPHQKFGSGSAHKVQFRLRNADQKRQGTHLCRLLCIPALQVETHQGLQLAMEHTN